MIALKLAALQANEQRRRVAVEKRMLQLRASDLDGLQDALDEIDLQPQSECTHRSIAAETRVSVSEVNAAIQRASRCGLVRKSGRTGRPEAVNAGLLEFIVHGVKYVYPAERGEPARGIPTAFAAPLLVEELAVDDDLLPVWPYASGSVMGYSLSPLYRSAVRPLYSCASVSCTSSQAGQFRAAASLSMVSRLGLRRPRSTRLM